MVIHTITLFSFTFCCNPNKALPLHFEKQRVKNNMDFNFIGTIWSLLPPVVAIALALKTKEVYSSLFIGIVLGAILYSMSMGTGFEGFLTHLLNDTVGTGSDAKQYGLISCLSDPWNVGIIVFLVILGSIVSLMNICSTTQ